MSKLSPELPEVKRTHSRAEQSDNKSLLSFLAARQGMILAILMATGSAVGCDSISCNCGGCELARVEKRANNNVNCSGCSGCSSCGTNDDECDR